MEDVEYRTMYRIEGDNWWYRGMRRITYDMLNRFYGKRKTLKILDAGCGTGANMVMLRNFGSVKGIDTSSLAVSFTKKRGLDVRKASVEDLPFKESSFDLVTSFDVIYHKNVKDDVAALREANRVLKKGGRIFIRAAAYDFLYGERDRLVHTARRYTKKCLRKKLEKAGFRIERLSYVNFFLFPLVLVVRTLERWKNRKKPASDLEDTNFVVNILLEKTLFLESALLKFISFPFGVSIVCIARKK